MPRYEFKEGSSSKFWEIELAGKAFTTTWGRIGTDGQKLTKTFKDEAAARREHDKLVAEKTKKGYAPVGNGKAGKPGKAAAPAKAAKAKPAASNPKLEQAILDDPEDDSAWLVYGDWLQEQGDPRGELLALHAKKQKARADKLIALHEETLLGPAAKWLKDGAFGDGEHGPMEISIAVTWRYGFLDSIHVIGLEEDGKVAEAVRSLFESPVGGFIRNVSFDLEEVYDGDSGQPNWGAVIKAMASAKPRNLRRLSWGAGMYQLSWTQLGGLAPLMPYLKNLESLHVNLGEIDLGKTIDLPKCTSLALETGGLSGATVRAIGAAKWPALEALTLYLGRDDYGGNSKIKDLQGILDATGFPKVKSLALCNSDIENDIAKAIGKSKIVKQLETLDLSKGVLDDTGGEALLESAGAFKHLKQLDLSEGYLSDDMCAKLKKLAKKVALDGQRLEEDEDPEYRYTVVGE